MIMDSAFFALDEISYGQHMFGWGTAESCKELNGEDETSMHNLHAIFDQVLSLIDLEFIDTGEAKENLFALFILLYCVSIRLRPKNRLTTGDEALATWR